MSSEAKRKANAKYISEKLENIQIRVPKGYKNVIKNHADSQGESMNAFICRAITETIDHDKQQDTDNM